MTGKHVSLCPAQSAAAHPILVYCWDWLVLTNKSLAKGTMMQKVIRYLVQVFFVIQAAMASWGGLAPPAVIAVSALGCAAAEHRPQYANTCDLEGAKSGAPDCLPPPAFFCISAEEAVGQAETQKPDPRFFAQGWMPSKYNMPGSVCPPNGTRLVQDQDWKDAKKGAKAIGQEIGRVITTCEEIVKRKSENLNHPLAGYTSIDVDELAADFNKCASALDGLPAIPQFEDPWLAGAAAKGFEEGYGEGVEYVHNRLLLLEIGLAAIEVILTGGAELVEVAITRGMRVSLSGLRRLPIFIPGAVGGVGVFLKGAPIAAVKVVVEGSSRKLGSNMLKRLILFPKEFAARLPGEFAHHIVAHGAEKAKKSLEILKKFGIGVDDWENGVYLPGYKTSPNLRGKIVHGNLHTDAYYEAVENALKGAKTRAEAIRELRLIAFKLEHGIMP